MNSAQEEYKNYSRGEYCHEQSFLWGFQEGAEWILDKLEELKKMNLMSNEVTKIK